MTNTPYYVPKARFGSKYGHQQLLDGIVKDGLTDVYGDYLMGICGEDCAKEFSITREEQDDYALRSYQRAQKANEAGYFKDEIVPVTIKGSRGKPDTSFEKDEEPFKVGRRHQLVQCLLSVQREQVPNIEASIPKRWHSHSSQFVTNV